MTKRLNKKGEIRVGTILFAFILFLVFLTSALVIVDDAFRWNYYGENLNTSYYGGFNNSRLDDYGTNSQTLSNTILGMNNELVDSDSASSGTSDVDQNINLAGFKSLLNLKGTYTFMKSLNYEINQKLGIPPYFLSALLLIIVIIITFGIISVWRGSGKL